MIRSRTKETPNQPNIPFVPQPLVKELTITRTSEILTAIRQLELGHAIMIRKHLTIALRQQTQHDIPLTWEECKQQLYLHVTGTTQFESVPRAFFCAHTDSGILEFTAAPYSAKHTIS